MSEKQSAREAYWQKNIRMVIILLILWALPSFGAGIIFVEQFNQFKLGGFPLGFWFAQQGSIYVFILLVLVYARYMDKLDAEFARDDAAVNQGGAA